MLAIVGGYFYTQKNPNKIKSRLGCDVETIVEMKTIHKELLDQLSDLEGQLDDMETLLIQISNNDKEDKSPATDEQEENTDRNQEDEETESEPDTSDEVKDENTQPTTDEEEDSEE